MYFKSYVRDVLKEIGHIPQAVADLGCGPRKFPGAFGVDVFKFPEVDKIVNLDSASWDLKDNSFDLIIIDQVFEHISDPISFLKEVHRIGTDNAIVAIAVPHFTSSNAYKDPTHKRHMSALWADTITNDNYLKQIVGGYESVSTRVTFGRGLRDIIANLIVKFFGISKYERRYAFMFPALDVHTILRIRKI